MDDVVSASGLKKSFGTVTALAGMDLQVRRGEVVGLLGPNGAGKTTTIKILLDLLRPTAGEVRVLGQVPRQVGAELHRRVGYLPGDFTCYPHRPVGDVLDDLARLRGGAARTGMLELAERLDLDRGRSFRQLSRGNRQKVGIIQAFMHRPELLVLDEPTTGLDPLLRQELERLLAEVRADGRSVLLSSHVLPEVQAVADRVAVMRAGRCVLTGRVPELRERAVRRVEVRFAPDDAPGTVVDVPDLADPVLVSENGERVLRGRLHGSPDALVKRLANWTVSSLLVEEPDLEDLVLELYDDGRRHAEV